MRVRLSHCPAAVLLGAVLAGAGLGAVHARARAQGTPIEPIEVPASTRLMAPSPSAQDRELQRLRGTAEAATGRPARDAAWLLGLLYLHGAGPPADGVQAQAWFERARQLGHPLAPAGLAWCEIDGCATAPNPAAARRWIAQLRRTDPGRALYLEWLAETRLAPLHTAATETAPGATPARPPAGAGLSPDHHALLARAAQAGNVAARVELGLDSMATGHEAEALGHFRAAAARSDAAAANVQLLTARHGPATVATPPTSAQQWFAQAQRYHRGLGVPANYAEAMRLYQLAASAGEPQSRRMLALIASRPTAQGGIDIAWMQQLALVDVSREGTLALLPASLGGLQREPTALYDLVPAAWRTSLRAPRR